MNFKKSNIFIISGPSGAGEDSIISGLEKYFSIERVITTSTREMRPGESQSNPYYFLAREEFVRRRDAGEFVEWAEQYNGNLYGVTKQEIERVKSTGKIGTWKIEWQGVQTVKKIFPEIPSIFITVSDLKILEERIRRRDNVTDEYIKERMEYTKEWLRHADIYDYTIINEEGKLDVAVAQVAEIIKKHL
jgi:guanylate kinase